MILGPGKKMLAIVDGILNSFKLEKVIMIQFQRLSWGSLVLIFLFSNSYSNTITKNSLNPYLGKGVYTPFNSVVTKEKKSTSLGLNDIRRNRLGPLIDSITGATKWMPFGSENSLKNLYFEELESASLKYLKEHYSRYLIDPIYLFPADRFKTTIKNKYFLTFHQKIRGSKVENAFVQFTYVKLQDGTFKLYDILNQTYGPVKEDEIFEEFNSFLNPTDFVGFKIISEKKVILPIHDKNSYSYKLGSKYLVEDLNDGFRYTVATDLNGGIQYSFSNFQNFSGVIRAEVFKRSYFDKETESLPLQHALVGEKFTGNDGYIEIEDGTYQLNLFSGGIEGIPAIGNPLRRINIVDFDTNGNPFPFAMETTLRESNLDLVSDSSESMTSLNTFVAINKAYDFARKHLDGVVDSDGIKGNEVEFLNGGILVMVNRPITNEAFRCNAFYDGKSLNFFVANEPCGNFGQLNDVIYHEWGHAFDDLVGPTKGITDPGFSEGLSDVFSAFINGDSRIAPGFAKDTPNGLRQLKNDHNKNNPDHTAEIHTEGTVIGGAFWDLRQMLETKFGDLGISWAEELFLKHLLITDYDEFSYISVLKLDDDDDDLSNGTPNYCLINVAFSSHGLAEKEKPCVDVVKHLKVQIVEESDNGELVLEVSSLEKKSGGTVAVCFGTYRDCERDLSEDIRFKYIKNAHAENHSRTIFRARSPIDVNENRSFNIMAISSEGEILGMQTVSIDRNP